MEFVEVKTKAAAEKAIKAGKAISIVAGSFTLNLINVDLPIKLSGDASPVLILEETSAPSIETWGTSAPRIETWETSAPSIDAKGYSYVFTRGSRLRGKAAPNTILRIHGSAQIEGGQQFRIDLSTNQDWCDFYGVPTQDDGTVILFKGVDANYRSNHGGDYTPGSLPEADKWDGGKVECSHGLHWSPTPMHSHQFVSNPEKYIAAPHKLDDIVVHWDGDYPQKCMTRATAGPVFEVDIDGNPVAVEVQP